ncbi:hypothetical protein QJQ45_003913 [Haematococcus lacustris]|nr:hypothetical protein QJQ45_003913 [Haematococcus lacustris]
MKLPLLNWKPVYSSGLAASYPSLTTLTLRFLDLSTCRLGRLVSHPALLSRLKHLDVCEADIVNKAQPAPSPFTGSRLQQLRLGWGYWDFTPHLAPLAPHLTQLAVAFIKSNESGLVGLTHPLHLALLGGKVSAGADVLAAAELNLCERNKAGLEVDDMWLGRGSFDLLTKQHVSRNCPAAHQAPHPTVASSSSGQEGSQGSAAGGQAPMQHLSYCVKKLLDLPEEILTAVLRQLDDGNSRLRVFMTSKRLATALLQHTPSIQLTHPLAVDLVCAPGDESLAVAVGTLTCLQSLKFDLDDLEAGDWFLPVLVPMLASLPSLHTLLLLQEIVHGDQVDVLLAATQITHLQVYSISCLVFSRVSAACSWRQLEVEEMDWLSAAHLPLHSLTHPLQLAQLGGVGPVGAEVLAAAELNLCERNKAGLEVEDMWLNRGSFDLLTAQYVSRSRPAAQQPPKPTVASSSSGQEGSQGSAAGGQAPMQSLGRCVKRVVLCSSHGWNEVLTPANLQAFSALFPSAGLELSHARP